jgi:PAS domain S-box-containing protein
MHQAYYRKGICILLEKKCMVKKRDKKKKQPIKELTKLRRRIAELEAAGHKRSQFEEALRTERDKAQHYLDIAEVMLVALNKKGEISLINRKGNQILGYKEGELLGKNWFTTCVPPPLRKDVKGVFLKLMEGKGRITEFYENPVLTKSGAERIITWHNTLLKNVQGTNIGALSSGEDITERRKAEHALRESEERFRLLAESSLTGIYLFQEGHFLYVNKALASIFGYKVEELVGHLGPLDLTHPDYRAEVMENIRRRLLGEVKTIHYDFRGLRKDGTVIFAEVHGARIEYSGKVGIIGTLVDITERKKAEKELREGEEKFRLAFENANTGVCLVDLEGNLTRVNSKMCEIFGYTKEELESMTVNDIAHQEDIDKSPEFIQKTLQGEIDRGTFEKRYFHKKGHLVTCEVSSSLVRDAEGAPLYFISHVHEITNRKQAEEALRESEEKYRLSFMNVTDVIYTLDTDLMVTSVSPNVESILGYKVEEVMNRPFHELNILASEFLDKAFSDVMRVFSGGQIPASIYEFIAKDGTRKIGEVSGSPLYRNGKIIGLISVARDITERKQAEKKLQESEQRYKTLFDEARIGICLADAETGIIIDCNQALTDLVGRERADLIGKPQKSLHPPQDNEEIFSPTFKQHLADKKGQILEAQIVTKAGDIREVEIKANLLDLQGRKVLQGLFHDITGRKQAEELIKIRLRLLEFAATHSLAELLQKTLNEVCEFTKSTVGFYHFVEQDQKTLSLQAWSTRTVEEFCKAAGVGMHYNIEEAGVWVDCIHERRPVIHNDYASLPHRRGMPEGHAAIVRELVVPIMRNDRFVAILGIGNKPQDYTDQDVQVVSYLADVAWEIAERKRTGEALEESAKKYREVVENATDIIYTTDINGNFTYANSMALKVTGYSLEELLRFNYLDLVVPKYRDQLKEIYGNQFRGRQATTYVEFPFSNKFGEVMWFGQNASLMIEGGKIIGFQVIARNISERKHAEEALRASEEKYRDLVENITDIIYATDEHGIITYISPVIEAVSGYSISEIIGHSFYDFIYEEDIPFMKEKFRQDISSQTEPHEYRMVTKSGVLRWVRTSSRPFFEGDRIVGLRGVLTDITDRKRLQETLDNERTELRLIIDSSPIIIFYKDKEGRFIRVNKLFAEALKMKEEDFVGKTVFDLYPPQIAQGMAADDQEIIQSGTPKLNIIEPYESAGGLRWVQTDKLPIFDNDGVPVGLIGFAQDITERKQAEEEIKRSYEQLQETLHATVNALAATVEMKDQYTAGHQPRVTRLACAIAEEMGLSEDQIEGIRMAASIHDIGKIMVPAEILNKPGRLTDIQYEMIKIHPQAGYDILKGLKLPWPVAQIILQHHERMDGSGYPQGLSGEKIMLEARILMVANVVEAMNAHRPYRPAYDIEEALAEISRNKGTFYDPAVVDACLRLFRERGFVLDALSR